MIAIMAYDSISVKEASVLCTTSANTTSGSLPYVCSMMPYITVCILDGFSGVASLFSVYIMYKWTTVWMDDGISTEQSAGDAIKYSSEVNITELSPKPAAVNSSSQESWFTRG